ncbi:MAG: bifunctional phosphopantothenoylcysteine decarboxylase/phosphopantothenate--cysteine ligase CoaBC [Alphaproteobacteria bacterium]
MNNFLKNRKILLIVTGGIACYRSLDLIRKLQELGSTVECILTKSSLEFVNQITFESLLGKKVHSNLFSLSEEKKMSHIYLANEMDIILVVPCTANFLSKIANGIADDLALNVLLASNKNKVIAPAMNTNMWENPIVKQNLKKLSKIKFKILHPKSGKLACGMKGSGKLMDIDKIIDSINLIFSPKLLSGLKVIITAGPSVERIDPVRFISNYSTGFQGYEIANNLSDYGADTFLISGPTKLEKPKNLKVINVESCQEFYSQVESRLPCDIFISVAAISDWKIRKYSNNKIKNKLNKLKLEFTRNDDILGKVSIHPHRPRLVIGFSAETQDLITNSKKKLNQKKCDWIIANKVSEKMGFGDVKNKIAFIEKNNLENWPSMNKRQIAKKITKKIVNFFKKK